MTSVGSCAVAEGKFGTPMGQQGLEAPSTLPFTLQVYRLKLLTAFNSVFVNA